MLWTCQKGHLEVVQWLICNGAANNTSTGHIDASVMDTLRGTGRFTGLQRALVPFWSSVFFLSITQIPAAGWGLGGSLGAGQVMVHTAPAI